MDVDDSCALLVQTVSENTRDWRKSHFLGIDTQTAVEMDDVLMYSQEAPVRMIDSRTMELGAG